MAASNLNQVTQNHVYTEKLKEAEITEEVRSNISELEDKDRNTEIIPFPEQSEASKVENNENQIDQLIEVIENFSHIREAHELRSELINEGLVKTGGKGKGLVAIEGVEDSKKLVAALKKSFKKLHEVSAKEAEEARISNLLADIAKQKTSNNIRNLSIAASDKGYIKRTYDHNTNNWEVTAVKDKEGSDKVAKAIMERKAEIETEKKNKVEDLKINNLLKDITKQKTSNDIRDLSLAANNRGYVERTYNRKTKDWEVTAIKGKEGSDKVAKAIMERKAEILASNKRASIASLLDKYKK